MAIGESVTPEQTAKEFSEGRSGGRPEGRLEGGVAAILRARRLGLGQNIEAVAQYLRIRAVYLRAIEEGHLENLPGPAYAIGFVRAYADYLGLDGRRVVENYREELAEGSRRNPLIWPADQVEHKHFPGTLVLILCLVLAGGLYGAWYYTSQSGNAGLDFMPETAEPAAPSSAAAPATPASTATTSTATNQSTNNQTDTTNAASTDIAPASPAVSESGNVQAVTTQAIESGNQTEIGTPPINAAVEEEDEGTPIPTEGMPAEPAAVPAAEPTNTVNADAVGVNQITVAQPAATNEIGAAAQNTTVNATGNAAVPGATNSVTATSAITTVPWASIPGSAVPAGTPAGRVQLRALQDSWIEVRDVANQVVMQRVLRTGETIAIPDLPGLVMVTGNAGGLVVEVDGKATPSLGPIGVIRRDINLDPNVLTSR